MTSTATRPTGNPLLHPWVGADAWPPFDSARPEHFEPAFEHAMHSHMQELDAIAAQTAAPGFDNTVAAFDRAGALLRRLEMLFHNLCASATTPELQAVQRRMAMPLSAHRSAVYMHAALFKRIDAVHEARRTLGLKPEQLRLLERVHLDFVRAGAQLAPDKQQRYAQVMQRLAALNTQFAQNLSHDESEYQLPLNGDADFAGLPDFVVAAARQAADERGLEGGAVITLSRSMIVPFLTFSERRDLREQAWRAWVTRGEHAGEHDNRPLVREILALRHEQAQLHGHQTYADYALLDRRAGTPAAVTRLVEDVWQRAQQAVQRERAQLLAFEGAPADLQAWDWRYWAEKVRQRHFAIDDAEVKPYFRLDRMVAAAFDTAERLFGIRFERRADLAAYHPDVKVYEVRDAAGHVLGQFLHDNFARPGKRSGAWMNLFELQSRNADAHGGATRPVVINNNNFAKGADPDGTLLSFDDVRTLFHEFGHALHGLLSNVTYVRLSGTEVLRDFVELPSQLFEHWMSEPAVLRRHALHTDTGEPIPEALIQRLQAARRFGQGYETARYCASVLVDMAVHSHPDPAAIEDVSAFEAQLMAARGLPPEVGLNHRLVHFQHLFSSDGYAAGYYVYLWAEVLDADGYGAFEEAGDPFDPVVAERLKRCVYSAGNSVEPGEAYRSFRGRDPQIEPLLKKRGLLDPVNA
jgi:peptidyl-dipeptidase Dcp